MQLDQAILDKFDPMDEGERLYSERNPEEKRVELKELMDKCKCDLGVGDLLDTLEEESLEIPTSGMDAAEDVDLKASQGQAIATLVSGLSLEPFSEDAIQAQAKKETCNAVRVAFAKVRNSTKNEYADLMKKHNLISYFLSNSELYCLVNELLNDASLGRYVSTTTLVKRTSCPRAYVDKVVRKKHYKRLQSLREVVMKHPATKRLSGHLGIKASMYSRWAGLSLAGFVAELQERFKMQDAYDELQKELHQQASERHTSDIIHTNQMLECVAEIACLKRALSVLKEQGVSSEIMPAPETSKSLQEQKVQRLRDSGWKNKDIADELGCSIRTVQRISKSTK